MKISGVQLVAELTGCDAALLDDEVALQTFLKEGITSSGLSLVQLTSHKFSPIGVTVIAIIAESHIAIHTFPEAWHASIDIYHCSDDVEPLHTLLRFMQEKLHARTGSLRELRRGSTLDVVDRNSISWGMHNGFEIRYEIERLIHSRQTPYHRIDVIANPSFGRMLFLNTEMQIAEYDATIYNKALVDPLAQAGCLHQIAILGGGDGGVLNEALQQGVDRATLVDIDREVIDVAKAYLPSICGQAFEHPAAEIVISDVNAYLEQEPQFDAMIYDLSCDPQLAGKRDVGEFFRELFKKVHRCLKPEGMLSIQCCSHLDHKTKSFIQSILADWFRDLTFNTVWIPSFCEPWLFATARKR